MLDLDDYETEYLSHQERKERGHQAVYSANLMGLSNLKPLEYIIFEHSIFCEYFLSKTIHNYPKLSKTI
jgi:hypothetical protein